MDREAQFILFCPSRIAHRRGPIDDKLAPQVRFLFITLHEHPIRPSEQLPIDVASGFPRVIKPVFSEFHAETMEGALVKARDEALYRLAREEFEAAELLLQSRVGRNGHGVKLRKASARKSPEGKQTPGLFHEGDESEEGLQLFHQYVFRDRADALIDHLTVLDEDDGRDVPDAKLHADVAVQIDVDLANHCAAVVVVRQFFYDRSDHAARTTPLGPKVDDNGLIAFQCELFEVRIGKFYSHDFSLCARARFFC
jgi:hypothetical protein